MMELLDCWCCPKSGIDWHDSPNDLSLLFLELNCSLTSSLQLLRQDPIHLYKALSCCARVISHYLQWTPEHATFALQRQLSTALIGLCEAAQASPMTCELVVEALLPGFSALGADVPRLSSLDERLRVRQVGISSR